MKETKLLGKLLPSHPDILPIFEEIREKYGIPEISPNDDSLKMLLEYELEIDWEAVHSEILEKVKQTNLLPENTKKLYDSIKQLQTKGIDDPEFEKVSEKFQNAIKLLFDFFSNNMSQS